MRIGLGPGEPAAGPWRAVSPEACLAELLGTEAARRRGRHVVAVDGRSGAGKSTLARRLQSCLAGSLVASADDLAWHAPMFGWAPQAVEGVLVPFRGGHPVRYRPPAWDVHDRAGHIEVPGDVSVLLFEGVGASQRALAELIDVALWVQSDYATAERLGIARDLASGVNGDDAASVAFWHAWMADENPFLARDRPWTRADLVVAGVGVGVGDPALLMVAPPPALG
jgi:hypothetical protein